MRSPALALCVLSAMAAPLQAAEPSVELRFQQMDARIKALEADGQKLRDQAAAAIAAADAARAELEHMKAAQHEAVVASVAAPAASSAAAGGANGNAFNPAISLILNGVYAHHSLNPDSYQRAGFPLVDGTGPGDQGFSLGESEVSFAANIDDKLYGQLTVSLENEGGDIHTGVEEAYIDTTSLPNGFSLRAGRFFSNIGYLNSHHSHTDNFVDRPLAYQAFLGNQYGDDGVQLRWVAPTDFFLELGGEAFRGANYPSGGATHSGVGAKTLFAHAGGDVGIENSWLAGLSVLKSGTQDGADGFSGDNTLYLADFTWKWAPRGNTKDGGVTLRGEYFIDNRDGAVDLTDPYSPISVIEPWSGTRHGAYVEGVYRINRRWDAGYRYDKLFASSAGPYASEFDPLRHTLELTWRNSEFSLLRVQYSHDEPNAEHSDNAFYLQYQVSLGAHGAHKF
ncbi:MAG: hypothetical protein ABI411_15525 [Tahibacter sp.]